MSKMTKAQKAERDEAVAKLREMLPPGSKVQTIVRHVSSSGMTRHISLVVARVEDGQPTVHDITWLVGKALDYRRNQKDGGLVVSGCGMDMGFAVVYDLGRKLYPDGGPLSATGGIRRMQAEREGVKKETDGGYLLKQEWI